ncbi:hypothetical protein DFJ58DRAFT_705076 [Suillus subalutaceus]|uniref:uncharacterized protein n=1 Tax=Suillus subalutaceus TaxID=48586 RepID=UPI001B873822|nr:uncharacterized protein DFJ58DRAFT_705076 [Suillus subalutaceus]KAG1848298.1 hypothetical protein DFJ58DRAFT_705076 [Suillus subalutaceus]
MLTCDILDCHNAPVRCSIAMGCCHRRLCSKHQSPPFHDCPKSEDDWDVFCKAFVKTETVELMALQQCISPIQLANIASSLRDDILCTIPALVAATANRPKLSKMMGGMNVHLDIVFDDSVVWLARIQRTTAVTPPPAVQNHILLSEFATLEYLNRIGVPTPTIHRYGLAADSNGIDVNYILMDKLQASPLEWYDLGPDQRRRVLHQLANIFITLDHHSFRQTGSIIQPHTSIGAFADRVIFEPNYLQRLNLLGPFTSLRQHLDHTINCHLRLIESSQWAVNDPVTSYLIYRTLLDAYPRILPAETMNGEIFCLRHQDDKGDHILVNDQLDILGIIDWEWSKVVAKSFAFAAPIMLLPLAFDEGSDLLSQDEEELAKIFDSLGRSDMALCVRDGRAYHRISFILDNGDRPETCKPHMKGLFQLLGNEFWEWETWRSDALRMYQSEYALQVLLDNEPMH